MGNTRASRLIDAEQAQKMQNAALAIGDLLVWTLYDRPADPDARFAARPFHVRNGSKPIAVHLESATLEGLRAQLPEGLTRQADSATEADVIETWA